jgi:hypothetical protein
MQGSFMGKERKSDRDKKRCGYLCIKDTTGKNQYQALPFSQGELQAGNRYGTTGKTQSHPLSRKVRHAFAHSLGLRMFAAIPDELS